MQPINTNTLYYSSEQYSENSLFDNETFNEFPHYDEEVNSFLSILPNLMLEAKIINPAEFNDLEIKRVELQNLIKKKLDEKYPSSNNNLSAEELLNRYDEIANELIKQYPEKFNSYLEGLFKLLSVQIIEKPGQAQVMEISNLFGYLIQGASFVGRFLVRALPRVANAGARNAPKVASTAGRTGSSISSRGSSGASQLASRGTQTMGSTGNTPFSGTGQVLGGNTKVTPTNILNSLGKGASRSGSAISRTASSSSIARSEVLGVATGMGSRASLAANQLLNPAAQSVKHYLIKQILIPTVITGTITATLVFGGIVYSSHSRKKEENIALHKQRYDHSKARELIYRTNKIMNKDSIADSIYPKYGSAYKKCDTLLEKLEANIHFKSKQAPDQIVKINNDTKYASLNLLISNVGSPGLKQESARLSQKLNVDSIQFKDIKIIQQEIKSLQKMILTEAGINCNYEDVNLGLYRLKKLSFNIQQNLKDVNVGFEPGSKVLYEIQAFIQANIDNISSHLNSTNTFLPDQINFLNQFFTDLKIKLSEISQLCRDTSGGNMHSVDLIKELVTHIDNITAAAEKAHSNPRFVDFASLNSDNNSQRLTQPDSSSNNNQGRQLRLGQNLSRGNSY